jgi:pimeloyl-ACP methyl ester carboxylesterase
MSTNTSARNHTRSAVGGRLATVAVRHGYTDVRGLRLHHLDYGGVGTPIVCLHGVTGHAWTWHELAPHLTEIGAVVCLDLRGHGDSQWSASGAYETEEHVADLEVWLDAMGLTRVALLGYSWGALIAASFAARRPERVRRLVMLDVEPSFDFGVEDVPPRPHEHDSHEDAVAWERESSAQASAEMVEVMAAAGTRPAPEGRLVPREDPYFLRRWPFRSGDHWSELAGLTMPVLVVHAGNSFVRREVMERMATVIPDAAFAEVADCGHVMPVDNPAGVASVVVPFLGGAGE